MNRPLLSGLALLLAGCPKHQQSAHLYQPAQTVAQFLILEGERKESLYVFDIKTDHGTMTIAYNPQGKKRDFADDILYLVVPPKPETLYADVGLDGTIDFISDMRESTPTLPFSFLPEEKKEEQMSVYTTLLDGVVTRMKAVYDMKKLEEVQPQ